MALTQFPSPSDLKLPFKDMVLDGKNHIFSKWDVSNPHPGYGTDPNILNEYGHTKYPMYVGNVIVNNEEEEKAERAKLEQPKSSIPQVGNDWSKGTEVSQQTEINNPWPTAK